MDVPVVIRCVEFAIRHLLLLGFVIRFDIIIRPQMRTLRLQPMWRTTPQYPPSLRMFQSCFVVSDLQCFCPPCSNRRAFAFGKRQPRGGCFSATAIGKVHWTFPSPLNTLNIGNNKCDEANLSDWISNQVYRLCSDEELFL